MMASMTTTPSMPAMTAAPTMASCPSTHQVCRVVSAPSIPAMAAAPTMASCPSAHQDRRVVTAPSMPAVTAASTMASCPSMLLDRKVTRVCSVKSLHARPRSYSGQEQLRAEHLKVRWLEEDTEYMQSCTEELKRRHRLESSRSLRASAELEGGLPKLGGSRAGSRRRQSRESLPMDARMTVGRRAEQQPCIKSIKGMQRVLLQSTRGIEDLSKRKASNPLAMHARMTSAERALLEKGRRRTSASSAATAGPPGCPTPTSAGSPWRH